MKKTKQLSLIARPEGMSLEEWQIALRKQAVEKMPMSVQAVRNCPGEFVVSSGLSKNKYRVSFHGSYSDWNSCECMDFKTSALGTCKHMETVKNFLKGKNTKALYSVPSFSSVYVSYVGMRQVKIRLAVSCPPALKKLASAFFSPSGILKEGAYRQFGEFLKEAQSLDPSFRCYDDARDLIAGMKDLEFRRGLINQKYTDSYIDSILKVPLYPYQKEGVRFACTQGRSIIADEMGLGKTVQAICAAEILRKESLADSVLVVCPTSLKYQWKSEIEKFSDAEVLVIEGGAAKRKEQYQANVPYKIVSYNSACNDIKLSGSLSADLVIMDEVQRLKNWGTQIAKAARKIKSQYTVILSGTPLENKLEELYSIVQLADQFCLGPYYQFRSDHIMTTESGKVIGYKDLNSIKVRLKDVLIRRSKSQVALQLPERIDKNLLVPMTGEQIDIHEGLKSNAARLIAKWQHNHFLTEQDRKRLLLTLSQMRMVCDSSYILDQETRFDTKVDEVMNIISDLAEEGSGKIVVFSQWERMTRLVAAELDARGFGYEYLHGGVPSEKRKDLIDIFTNDSSCLVFLSTDAGATGLNLQAASTIINIDLPWNPAVLEQRIARIWRIGQQNNIQVINLIATGSIEEAMVRKLRFKSSMFEGVLDNGEDTVYADDDKFGAIIDTVGSFFTDVPEVPVAADEPEPVADANADAGADDAEADDSIPENGTGVLAKGLDFFGSLAQTLRSEESTKLLVESLVKEEDGKTFLKIPVSSKNDVETLLGALGTLLRNKI